MHLAIKEIDENITWTPTPEGEPAGVPDWYRFVFLLTAVPNKKWTDCFERVKYKRLGDYPDGSFRTALYADRIVVSTRYTESAVRDSFAVANLTVDAINALYEKITRSTTTNEPPEIVPPVKIHLEQLHAQLFALKAVTSAANHESELTLPRQGTVKRLGENMKLEIVGIMNISDPPSISVGAGNPIKHTLTFLLSDKPNRVWLNCFDAANYLKSDQSLWWCHVMVQRCYSDSDYDGRIRHIKVTIPFSEDVVRKAFDIVANIVNKANEAWENQQLEIEKMAKIKEREDFEETTLRAIAESEWKKISEQIRLSSRLVPLDY